MLGRVLVVLSVVLHLPIIYLIYYLWQPISSWYLAKVPAIGVDLYLSATYVAYHLRNGLSLPFNSFKDFWFGGNPLMRDFPQLAFYLMMPFAARWGIVEGVRQFTVFALLAIVVSCYFLFYKLSKNHGLAFLLAILVLLSPNIYGAATWAGSIPYFFSQAIFPLGLLAGVFYLEGASVRTLAAMMLVVGVGFLIHPLSVMAFLIPSLSIVVIAGGVFWSFPLLRILKHLALFNVGWILAAFTVTYDYVITTFTQRVLPAGLIPRAGGSGGPVSETATAIAQFYRDQIALLYTRTDNLIFALAVLGVVAYLIGLAFSKRRRRVLFLIAFLLIALWCVLHPALNLGGVISFFRHDPYRAFWQFTIAIGAVAALLWGELFRTFYERTKKAGAYLAIGNFVIGILFSIVLVAVSYVVFNQKIDRVLPALDTNVELSSAFPEVLGIKFKSKELEQLKSQLVPSFLDPADRNRRLYSADATVNIWWNALFEMPLARGYIDPPVGARSRGGFFWLDIAIANDTLVRDFAVSEEVALKNTLFLMDWYAIGFFEGGRLSSKGPSVGPSSYLLNNNVFDREAEVTTYGAVLKYQTASGKPELVADLPQNLHYFKVADEFTSAVLAPTNAAAFLVVSTDSGYEDILRVMATENLNSRRLIPARAANIDDLNISQLKAFDAVILHQYSYKNRDRAFGLLAKYVREGGKLFIDTGAEVRESNLKNLPEVFPFSASERGGWGRDWDLTGSGSDLLANVDTGQFGPLVFGEDEWKLTIPQAGDLRGGVNVILANRGRPVLTEHNLGQGKVIWSGLNLAYHYNQYKSADEAKLFLNMLSNFSDVSARRPIDAEVVWQSPQKVVLKTEEAARGILFKEQGWDGWSAKVNGKRAPIYLAGPTFPGFIYVPVDTSGSLEAVFSYNGTWRYLIVNAINLVAILILADLWILNGRLFGRSLVFLLSKINVRVGRWWDREEE